MAKDRALTGEEAGERKRHRLPDIVSAVSVDAESLAFQHSIFCQTGLPYRNPGPGVCAWERVNGGAHLMVLAGAALDPAKNQ